MQSLIDNARSFPERASDLRRFAEGQHPQALFIACSDSRVVPTLITGAAPGELFELRTAGSIVPVYDEKRAFGEVATIEFAVEVLQVKHIVVCGHSHCGAVNAIVHPGAPSALPAVHQWLADTGPHDETRRAADFLDGSALTSAVQRHVQVQLERLRSHPSVAKKLEYGRLELHGWFYAVDAGVVSVLEDERFRPL
ncbi:carbonic anhydrase [Actinomadura sp. DC4]|uniref:carbonic anhydrase n=1 Tax=Actinomadura sp. DC4 TaxID=3055069 RepID=UPI0025B0F061|nr:carbonic anhydrase [Actinomadura sp. DC4]MDN3355946.1 carbonic anhydrase [Actinomadura sp. DC4]